jgi:hypothetical protein
MSPDEFIAAANARHEKCGHWWRVDMGGPFCPKCGDGWADPAMESCQKCGHHEGQLQKEVAP